MELKAMDAVISGFGGELPQPGGYSKCKPEIDMWLSTYQCLEAACILITLLFLIFCYI
jgi:hypothetical protein